jgi:hypothetical protein
MNLVFFRGTCSETPEIQKRVNGPVSLRESDAPEESGGVRIAELQGEITFKGQRHAIRISLHVQT